MLVDNTEVTRLVSNVQTAQAAPESAQHILSLLDLTSLNAADDQYRIRTLCAQANNTFNHIAAVCILPEHVNFARELLKATNIKIATVVNFPEGDASLEQIEREIAQAKALSVDEIDIVFPYHQYLAGLQAEALNIIKYARDYCGNDVTMKVILEVGKFVDYQLIAKVSREVIEQGADFIKTSTGKISAGATLHAAAVMLMTIEQMQLNGYRCGFKASGGITTPTQAIQYLQLAKDILGESWPTTSTFRIGASQLIVELFEVIGSS